MELVSTEKLIISQFDPERVQPASYDVTLDSSLMLYRAADAVWMNGSNADAIDVKKSLQENRIETIWRTISPDAPFCLQPGGFLLASTSEAFRIPSDIVARVEGKSSLGRLGLIVHATAGYIDPGFDGTITLEIVNLSKFPITLYAGMPIAQISFSRMTSPALRPYGSSLLNSKYQNQNGPTESRYSDNYKDFDVC